MKAFQISIFGNVQKIGFRFHSMEKAYQLSIRGFVQYHANGSIYMEAEGEDENINQFLEWCRRGPLGGIVKEVMAKEIPTQNFPSFDIRSGIVNKQVDMNQAASNQNSITINHKQDGEKHQLIKAPATLHLVLC